jgi:hypothetical protein
VTAGISDWFAARLPPHWGARGVEVMVDQDEILVVVDLSEGSASPDPAVTAEGAGPDGASGEVARVRRFRESTRDERMSLATAAEAQFGRKVSWGVRHCDAVVTYTTTSVPVMTRLRLPERMVLDTLIDAGVARSRSEALAWCVRLVGEHEKEWIAELRDAFEAVVAARRRGPRSRPPEP